MVDVKMCALLAPTVFYSTTGNEITEITKKGKRSISKSCISKGAHGILAQIPCYVNQLKLRNLNIPWL